MGAIGSQPYGISNKAIVTMTMTCCPGGDVTALSERHSPLARRVAALSLKNNFIVILSYCPIVTVYESIKTEPHEGRNMASIELHAQVQTGCVATNGTRLCLEKLGAVLRHPCKSILFFLYSNILMIIMHH